MERRQTGDSVLRRGSLYALLVVAAVIVPPWIAAVEPASLASSYGRRTVAFELLAAALAAVFATIAALEWRRRRPASLRAFLPVAVPLAIGLHFAYLLGEYPLKPFDYDCYEYAGRALQLGENPYRVGLNYLYPPLTAQAFAVAYEGAALAANATGRAASPDALWDGVFYLYQCAQLGLIVALYFLLERFARVMGVEAWWAPLLVGALLLFDDPLLRTLRHGQINLWVLDLSLLALLLARRAPAAAGAALALAVHIKLYPLVLLLPFAAARCWRAWVWTGAALAGVVVLQTNGLRDWTLWGQFVEFSTNVYPGEIAFRNNSFHSLAWNAARLWFELPPAAHRAGIRLAASAVSLAMAAWLLIRVAARARLATSAADGRRLLADGADALALSLLISQSVWEHHYVLALPLAICVVANVGSARPLAVTAALFLAIGMPTFDLFPLSYHRAVGLVWLLLLGSPRRTSFES